MTVTLVKEEDGGEYEVRAENELGSVTSKSTVTVTSEYHTRCANNNFRSIDIKSKIISTKKLERMYYS